MYSEISGKENSETESDEETGPSGDEPEPAGTDKATRTSDTDRLEDIQEGLRQKEKELAEVRDELEPELREKGNEIKDLRRNSTKGSKTTNDALTTSEKNSVRK